MLIGLLKVLAASLLPTKYISQCGRGDATLSSHVIPTLSPDTPMFGLLDAGSVNPSAAGLALRLTGLVKVFPPSVLLLKIRL